MKNPFRRQRLLKEVFTPGGQPSVTYVKREHLGVESALRKAVALPTTIVSLTGPTKSGKTVLCKTVLKEKHQFVWVDGGQVKNENDLWAIVCSEFKLASELTTTEIGTDQVGGSMSGGGSIGVPGGPSISIAVTANGSALSTVQASEKHVPSSMRQALEYILAEDICLVIDDFHYIPDEVRESVIRTIKGPVFRGLKVILLSTPHRAFEAIRAESEITGRFKHVTVPTWSVSDLEQIALTGFKALNVSAARETIQNLTQESEGSPLLMQRFCWGLCFDSGIEQEALQHTSIPQKDLSSLFDEVAEDAGLPIYERLAKGPQSRTDRIRRPLIGGGDVDIYEAILLAVARTGPKERLSYDQIRSSLNSILLGKVPQKLEVSNALNQLTTIASNENKTQRALDWDSENLDLFITDPFFRFYLKWKVAR